MCPLIQVLAIRSEELHAVALAAAYHNPSIGADVGAVRQTELTGTRTGFSPGLDQFPVSGESMNPGIAIPRRRTVRRFYYGDSWTVKGRPSIVIQRFFSYSRCLRAPRGYDYHELLTVGSKLPYRVIAAVRDVNRTIRA
jgi:hypothetical protein